MSFPYFISPEQAMRERTELARKGIARGRSVVVLAYAGGVLFVAENPSRSLQKVSELYDRVGFAAVGRFNEFDNLRRGGHPVRRHPRIRLRPARRHRSSAGQRVRRRRWAPSSPSRPSRTRSSSASPRSRTTARPKPPELYRITYDGSIADEPHFVVMGGTTEPISTALKESYTENASWATAVKIAVNALQAGMRRQQRRAARVSVPATLEVAILDANRPRRAFRRITGSALEALLPVEDSSSDENESDA